MFWSYLIHLNKCMWQTGDPDWAPNLKLSPQDRQNETEKIMIDWELYDTFIKFLPTQGINTVLIDVGNGVRLERHPEICQKEAMTKDELKKMCDEIRALGMEPIPKLNFSCGHNPWMRQYRYMVGTDEYYRFCDDVIDEVAELFGYPKYFHLGLDEEQALPNVRSGLWVFRAPHIWWRDAFRLFKRCEHNNARPWVWSDDYWHRPEEFLKNMPKSVLQSNWDYCPPRGLDENGKYRHYGFQSYVELEEHGYDQVPTCSTWLHDLNTDETFRLAKAHIAPERLKGIMTAPWDYIYEESFHLMMQEAVRFGTAKKKYFPQEDK